MAAIRLKNSPAFFSFIYHRAESENDDVATSVSFATPVRRLSRAGIAINGNIFKEIIINSLLSNDFLEKLVRYVFACLFSMENYDTMQMNTPKLVLRRESALSRLSSKLYFFSFFCARASRRNKYRDYIQCCNAWRKKRSNICINTSIYAEIMKNYIYE